MKREDKAIVVDHIKNQLNDADFFYIADTSALTVKQVNALRAICFENGVSLQVSKNTLVRKAMEGAENDYDELYDILKGPTSLMFSENINAPAKIIKQFRKDHDKPILKAAYIDSALYIGDDNVEVLASLKSKEELIGEIIGLLESPIQSVLGALNSGENTIMGVLDTLENRAE